MIKLSRLFHYKLTVHIAVLQPHICRNIYGLGYSLFARRYWGNHFCFLFLWLLRCFSSPGWLQMMTSLQLAGFPHSEIYGSKVAHTSPQLIAACHVLHRLCMPRHPPNALKTLDRSHYHHPPIAVQHMTNFVVMRSVDRQIAQRTKQRS